MDVSELKKIRDRVAPLEARLEQVLTGVENAEVGF